MARARSLVRRQSLLAARPLDPVNLAGRAFAGSGPSIGTFEKMKLVCGTAELRTIGLA
jgi:hypothetical protein